MSTRPPTAQEMDQLKQALLDAFSLEELRQLVRIELDVELEQLVPTIGQSGDQIADHLVRAYAAQKDGLKTLLHAARGRNPHNEALQAVAAAFDGQDFTALPLPDALTPYRTAISATIGEHVTETIIEGDQVTHIDTGGGAAVSGDTSVSGGDFVGRDKITYVPTPEVPCWVNVPAMPSPFLGRDELVTDLVQRLTAGQTTALSAEGLPGVGKTALAIALARHPDVLAHFSDGLLWAGLGRSPDTANIQATWAQALEVDLADLAGLEERRQRLSNAMGQRRVLLVLDDAWQLDAAMALRCTGPHVVHILTTRNEEIARAFAGAAGCHKVPLLDERPSHALLAELASEAWAADPQAVRDLADRVDGLPLALELLGGYLAGSRQRRTERGRERALQQLDDPAARLALATVRLGDGAAQAVTLQETIALSLEGLPDESVACFHALGAFAPKPARFDLDAALAVTGADEERLLELVDGNLVAMDDEEQLSLHQTVADVARVETLPGQLTLHRTHYLDRVDADPEDWRRIDGIYPQISFAWHQREKDAKRFIDSMSVYQTRRGLLVERIDWLHAAGNTDDYAKDVKFAARLVHELGYAHSALGDKPKALDFYNRALPLRREVGDKAGEATTLNNIGGVHSALGDKPQALDFYYRALPLQREVGDKAGEVITRWWLGLLYSGEGKPDLAEKHLRTALDIAKAVQSPHAQAVEQALMRLRS